MRNTVSLDSEPELVKNTRFICAGAISVSAVANSAAGAWVHWKKVL